MPTIEETKTCFDLLFGNDLEEVVALCITNSKGDPNDPADDGALAAAIVACVEGVVSETLITQILTDSKDVDPDGPLAMAIQACVEGVLNDKTILEPILQACIDKEFLADVIQGNNAAATVEGVDLSVFGVDNFKFGFNFGEPSATGIVSDIGVNPTTAADIVAAFQALADAQGIVITLALNGAGDAIIATAGDINDIGSIEVDPGAFGGTDNFPVGPVTP